MDNFLIKGGKRLFGAVDIVSAKNACLPILASALLNNEEVVLKGIPKFSDCLYMEEILRKLGAEVLRDKEDNVIINAKSADSFKVEAEIASKIRSSIFLLGAIISKFKRAEMALPGGCDIGLRPIDIHIKGLEQMGVKFKIENGYIYARCNKLTGAKIVLDFPSVGATENLIMAASLAEGTTTIINAAKEPEVEDLCNFLNKSGAKIYGGGTSEISITGVKKLHRVEYSPIKDRIIAGTYMLAAAITGGKIEIKGAKIKHLLALTSKLIKSGCQISEKDDIIEVISNVRLKSAEEVITNPYPQFPTDLMPPMAALETVAEGISVISENLFESRFKFCGELNKMGAEIRLLNRKAIISGKERLYGAEVQAEDLRGGAALVIAGLKAEGQTTVKGAGHIDRGYYKIEDDLRKLGADICRLTDET